MNIYSYDPVSMRIDWNKTWINFRKCILYSREFKIKKYFFVATKYDKLSASKGLYIVFTDIEPEDNRIYGISTLDKCGRFRTNIKDALEKVWIPHEEEIENIDVSIDDEDEDSIAYRIG